MTCATAKVLVFYKSIAPLPSTTLKSSGEIAKITKDLLRHGLDANKITSPSFALRTCSIQRFSGPNFYSVPVILRCAALLRHPGRMCKHECISLVVHYMSAQCNLYTSSYLHFTSLVPSPSHLTQEYAVSAFILAETHSGRRSPQEARRDAGTASTRREVYIPRQ
jgi:hypothetical protein